MSNDPLNPEKSEEAPESLEQAPETAAQAQAPEEPVAPEAPAEAPEEEAAPGLASGLDIGSQGAGDEYDEPIQRPEPVIRGKIDRFGVAWGTGRRKTSVARVRLNEGKGEFIVNDRKFEEYFATERDRQLIFGPLRATGLLGKVNLNVRVNGGGTTGQTGAVVLGISRAIQAKHPELHHMLSEGGFLTRDGRMVERKKYGLKKARRSFQFSKR